MMYEYLRQCNWSELTKLLTTDESLVTHRDKDGNTIIHLICQRLRRKENADEKRARVSRGIVTYQRYVQPHYEPPQRWGISDDEGRHPSMGG